MTPLGRLNADMVESMILTKAEINLKGGEFGKDNRNCAVCRRNVQGPKSSATSTIYLTPKSPNGEMAVATCLRNEVWEIFKQWYPIDCTK